MLLSPRLRVPGLSPPSPSEPTPVEKKAPVSTMLRAFKALLELSSPSRPAKPLPRPCWPDEAALLCFESDAKPLGMSCWVPIFRAGPLLVLSTMEGRGEVELADASEGEDEAEVEEEEQDEGDRTCDRSSWAEAVDAEDVCRLSMDTESMGDGERGVGGSEEFKEERDGMLEEEQWESGGVRRVGGEGLGMGSLGQEGEGG